MAVRAQKFFVGMVMVAALLVPSVTYAQSLTETLTELVRTHKRMLAADADVKAATEQLEVTWGDWYPSLSVTANIGHEKQQKPTGSDDTDMVPRQIDTTITQRSGISAPPTRLSARPSWHWRRPRKPANRPNRIFCWKASPPTSTWCGISSW